MMVFETHRLSFWEECAGILVGLHAKDGLLIALVGKISLALPLEMEEKMRPHMGERISLLRTDIPNRQYLIRVLFGKENKGE